MRTVTEKLLNIISPICNNTSHENNIFLYSKRHTVGMKNILKYNKPSTTSELYDLVFRCSLLGTKITLEKYKIMYGEELGAVKYNIVYNKRKITLNNMISKYGDTVGREKFNLYCKKQSYSNSFEYKHNKYDMTREAYNEYNLSRAVTLNNMISKYGDILGRCKYDAYCKRQSYTNSKEYLGENYERINKLKSHTIQSYIDRYGEIEGTVRFEKYIQNSISGYSVKSQLLFDNLLKLEPILFEDCYYATKNKEYGVLDIKNQRYYKYDFVVPSLKLCIEFNGDHYHGNPKIYSPNDKLKGRGCTNITAIEKWKYDDIKINLLKTERYYDTIIVWESDYDSNFQDIITRIIKYAKNRI